MECITWGKREILLCEVFFSCMCVCLCAARSQRKICLHGICRFWLKRKFANTSIYPHSVESRGLKKEPWATVFPPSHLVSVPLGLPTHSTQDLTPSLTEIKEMMVLIARIRSTHLNRNSTDTVMKGKLLEKVCFMEFWAKKAFTLISDSLWRELTIFHKKLRMILWNSQSIKSQIFSQGFSPWPIFPSCYGCSHNSHSITKLGVSFTYNTT